MKGVLLTICPAVTIVDITHEIPPQDIVSAALELDACWRYFPAGTIFVVVVDPGVGSGRPAVAAEAGGAFFVGPDNGVFGAVFESTPPDRIVALTDPKYALASVSRTFEGRDRFAPAAAWLATGVDLDAMGKRTTRWRRLDLPLPRPSTDGIDGEIVRIDRFGNLVTNITRSYFEQAGLDARATVEVKGLTIGGLVATYADASPGQLCALFGSSGHLEIAAAGSSAASALGTPRGTTVHVRRSA